jgi:hypothetical protein
MTPAFLASTRMKRQTTDRIFDFLDEAERFDAMAGRILAEPNKPTNWTLTVAHCRERAAEERQWAAALARGTGLDYDRVVRKHIRRNRKRYAK